MITNRFALLVTAYFSVWVVSAGADSLAPTSSYDPEADWCTDELNFAPGDERFVPDGVVVQIGEAYFRVCRSPIRSIAPERRTMRFFYNPQRVPGLIFDRSMIGVRVTSLLAGRSKSWKAFFAYWRSRHVKTTEHEIGGLTYQGFRSFDKLTQSAIGVESLFYEGRRGDVNDAVPQHIVKCDTDLGDKPKEVDFCSITTGYGTLQASLWVYGGTDLGRRIPANSLPVFAQDLMRILKAADVTDRLNEFEQFPIIR